MSKETRCPKCDRKAGKPLDCKTKGDVKTYFYRCNDCKLDFTRKAIKKPTPPKETNRKYCDVGVCPARGKCDDIATPMRCAVYRMISVRGERYCK